MVRKADNFSRFHYLFYGIFNDPTGICIYNIKNLFKRPPLSLVYRPSTQPFSYRVHTNYVPTAIDGNHRITYRVEGNPEILLTCLYLLFRLFALSDVLMGTD